ncbi:50S ribosomal protein L19 [Salibacteraceae bacterium]|jgi:large subunit ribosomal protein L19|nr:50S ribosomal protein L19 [Crocinitomicaceae bacterium]MCH9822396.1 50S ribosomal protein L19 [Bacteroidota bacterium]MDA9938404.1 50S ribosomal protein L19 [Salibacteraceae bacterium]MDA9967566.1 50S ribosomal protein L19 [Salibacteraceae bacterium]MDB9725156.1 50S ribosomal protein L19 [Salibacteraceae bacterium]|tara:strand:- start:12291 stop:12641 length:351 start_codon:yes stop_codon:yes gene_type:complete
MDQIIKEIEAFNVLAREDKSFKAGDTITLDYKIKEGEKERIQQFRGVVIQKKGSKINGTFTVRKVSNGIGVERIFPISSPAITNIAVNKVGVVRRSRIYYLRDLKGKAARIQEKRR